MSKAIHQSKSTKTHERCWWCGEDPLYVAYHDHEWGVPVYDDRKIFEMLVLESFQAGLSWITILRKRENFKKAFAGFDPEKVARFGKRDINRLLKDAGIVRNRQKIEASINNTKRFLEVQEQQDGFSDFIWSFVDHKPLLHPRPLRKENLPTTTPESDRLAKELKKRGFAFLGSTVLYAHMQATGMVDDHVQGCFRYRKR